MNAILLTASLACAYQGELEIPAEIPDPKLPEYAFGIDLSIDPKPIDKRSRQPRATILRGPFPKLSSGLIWNLGEGNQDPGRDVICGKVLPDALRAKTSGKHVDSATGKVHYFFDPYNNYRKFFVVDKRNRVVSFSASHSNDVGAQSFKNALAAIKGNFGKPTHARRTVDELQLVWKWSKGANLFLNHSPNLVAGVHLGWKSGYVFWID